MTDSFSSQDVKILNDEILFNGFFKVRGFKLQHRLFEGGWSEVMQRERFERGHAAGVLIYDPQLDCLAMVEQFRVGALADENSPWLLELVAGIVESGESAEQVAIREAQEEADCQVSDLVPIAKYYSSPGGCDEMIHLYCGRADLSQCKQGVYGLAGENEDIRLHLISFTDAQNLLENQQIRNGLTLIALQWLILNKASLQSRWL